MEVMSLSRPPVVPKKMWLKWILIPCCLAVGLFLIITSIHLAKDYQIRAGRAVELSAIVTHVEKVIRGDFTDYDVYVSYEYNGKQYSNWLYSDNEESAYDRIGDYVSIIVDSEDPEVEIDDLSDGYFFSFFFGLPIFALGFGLLAINGRKTYVESYGKSQEAIKADQIMESRRRILWLPLLICSIGSIIWGICLRNLDGIFAGAIALGALLIPLWGVLLVRYIIDQRHNG